MMFLNQKGFTLIEVLAVIVIIAILGLVSVPSVLNAINNSKSASYDILIDNIKTAGSSLYEEIDLLGNEVYIYNADGNKSNDAIKVNDFKIEVNLQTLVSNGFLKGTANEDSTSDKSLVLLNPKTNQDIGSCVIEIEKLIDIKDKVTYNFTSKGSLTDTDLSCPITDDFK